MSALSSVAKKKMFDFLLWQLFWATDKNPHSHWKMILNGYWLQKLERATAQDLCDPQHGFGFVLRLNCYKLFWKSVLLFKEGKWMPASKCNLTPQKRSFAYNVSLEHCGRNLTPCCWTQLWRVSIAWWTHMELAMFSPLCLRFQGLHAPKSGKQI